MAAAGLDALLPTTEPEVRYYTGFPTRFRESPTRPCFAVLPRAGATILVILSIGAHLTGQSRVQDIRSWAAPDYRDDGVGLLADALRDTVPKAAGSAWRSDEKPSADASGGFPGVGRGIDRSHGPARCNHHAALADGENLNSLALPRLQLGAARSSRPF